MKQAWALATLAFLAVAGPSAAQPQADAFNGQFGVMELPLPPAEAARQAQLLGESLANLAPQRPGQLDVYVLSAGLWSDPVFEREASQAEAILREHLGAEGRTIMLSAGLGVAGYERRYPAASPNNLIAAMGRIGEIIDQEEDLVVLFLTTHGSPDGTAALREHDRLQAGLRPVHLRDALAAANIQNRIIIVSACYSGAFIAPLANDNTIIMTAAAPNRASFGCQPENDWTFFGDAYFNRAVRGGANMLPAFDEAKTLIQQWESERNLTPPSNPQRYVGSRAAAMLARAERDANQ
jgi:hypothetical protein